MRADAALTGVLVGFLLVLTRVGAFFVFVPIPGGRAFPAAPKILLTLLVACMLSRYWWRSTENVPRPEELIAALAAEAAFGLLVGTGVALLVEGVQLAAQFIGLQAGFSYASTIDPNSEADSGIMLILMQLSSSLVFFTCGLDRRILGALADSFARAPAGSYHLARESVSTIVALGASMFQIGLRLALPVIAVLMIADVSLALLGKLEQHLQLSVLMFPMKTLVSLVIVSALVGTFNQIVEGWFRGGWELIEQAMRF